MSFNSPKIAIALSGGAARGNAHVGVLRALAENNIRIDYIAGTSCGAVVGGALATGMSLDQIEELGRKIRWRNVGRVTMSWSGLQTNKRFETYLRAHLPVSRFEDLPIPFAAVATDLNTGSPVILRDQGDVPFAIRASCTIPGWYVPVIDEQGRQLVDGGLVAVIPSVVTRSLGADIVIAVDVNSVGATFIGPTGSVLGVLLQSMMVVQKTLSAHQRQMSDFVIDPKVGQFRWDNMGRADELMTAGYEAALKSLPEIRDLIDSAGDKEEQREEILA